VVQSNTTIKNRMYIPLGAQRWSDCHIHRVYVCGVGESVMEGPESSAPLLVGCGTEHAVYRYNGSDPRLSGCVLKLSHAVVAARAASVAPLPALVQALGQEYAAEPICAVPLESSLACALSDAARHGVPPARFVARAVHAAMEAAVAEAAPGKPLPSSPSSGQHAAWIERDFMRLAAGCDSRGGVCIELKPKAGVLPQVRMP
jgi:hypothetical protein